MQENKIISLLLPFCFGIMFEDSYQIKKKVSQTVTETVFQENTVSNFRKLYSSEDFRPLREHVKQLKNIEFRGQFFVMLRKMILHDLSVTKENLQNQDFAEKLGKLKQETITKALEEFFEKNLNGVEQKQTISWGNFLKFQPILNFRAGNDSRTTSEKLQTQKISKKIINITTRLISKTTSLFSWKDGESIPENLRDVISPTIKSKKEFFQQSFAASIAFIRKYRPFLILVFLVFIFREPLLRLFHTLVKNIKFVQKKNEWNRLRKELANLREMFKILEKELAEKKIDAQVDEKVIAKLKKDLKACQNKEN